MSNHETLLGSLPTVTEQHVTCREAKERTRGVTLCRQSLQEPVLTSFRGQVQPRAWIRITNGPTSFTFTPMTPVGIFSLTAMPFPLLTCSVLLRKEFCSGKLSVVHPPARQAERCF